MSTVGRPKSTITFGMVFSTTWLETQKYSLYPKEYPAYCPLWWRLSNGLGVYLSWLQLVTIQGNLTGDQYIRDVLQPVVVPHFDNHPLATRHVYMNDNARPHRSRAVTAYLQSETVTSVPWPAMSPDLYPIEHIWDMLRPSYTCLGNLLCKTLVR